MPSLYWTWPLAPGNSAGVVAGTWDRLAGKVTGRCPEGLTAPNRTAAAAVPSTCPGYHCSTMPATLFAHGMVTAEPVLSTTIVLGLAAATALIRLSSVAPRSMLVRSEPSLSV